MKGEDAERMGWSRFAASAVVLCGLALLAAAPLPKAWENWQYSRAILASPAAQRRLTVVAIPLELSRHAQGSLADLRVIDDQGNQVPFIFRLPPGAPVEVARPSTIRENIFAKGEYSQVVLDIGPTVAYHNTIAFGTSASDYVVSAEVALSDNDVDWRDAAPASKLFRFESASTEWEQSLHYPESNARYVRLRILAGDQPFPILHPQVEYREASPEESSPLDVAFLPTPHPPAGRSEWTLDLGSTGAPAIAVGFKTTEPQFHRRVYIQYSADGAYWNHCTGEIYRLERNNGTFERLCLAVAPPESRDRYWRVEVIDGDDRPLEALQLQLYVAPRRLVFWQEPGKSYWLLYGQFRSHRPIYDLAARTDFRLLASAVPAELGPENLNTAYVPPIPWTERHESLMWAALVFSLLLLGFTAFHSLRRIPPADD